MAVIALGAIITPAYSQVKSTDIISVTQIVNGLIVKHLDSTVTKNDTFWSLPERAFTSSFFPAFPCNKTRRIGSGTYYDTIMSPLVAPGTMYWIRVNIGNDSTLSVKKTSGIQTSTPLYPVTDPTLTIGNATATINGGYYSHSWDPGYDSATITRSVSIYPDSMFQYSWDSIWKVASAGTNTMQIVGMPNNKKIYVREVIRNSKNSVTQKVTWTTSATPSKAFIYKNLDSTIITESSADIYGKVITYGLSTTVKAIAGTNILTTESVAGENGSSLYHIRLTNLNPNTNYSIKLKAENSIGSDSVIITFTTPIKNSQTFSVVTDSLIRQSGTNKARLYGKVNVVSGNAEIYGGLFTDQTCSLALLPSSSKLTFSKVGINTLYAEFDIDTNASTWGRFWGTDDKGRFDLNPTAVKLKIVYFSPTTGIDEVVENWETNVYPNPATDVLNVPSLFGQYEIYNSTGQLVKEKSDDLQIDVSLFPNGIYFIKSEKITKKFFKN